MKKICIVTAARSEYGVLRHLIKRILIDDKLELCLVVTGAHLSRRHGYTVDEIEKDHFPISEKIEFLEENNTETDICRAMGKAGSLFGEMYERQKPDMVVVVGDRYELLPICSSAMIFGIPIAHISGGEITEGAIDDTVRHCITKMSYLHFPGCEEYRQRIIQLGEEPERVFNFGDIGVENILQMEYLSRKELEKYLGISLAGIYASVTFHPVTLEKHSAEKQANELVSAMTRFPEITFIVTMSNADLQGQIINHIFEASTKKYSNIHCYISLGIQRYLSLLKYADFVIGNSSSGIIEAPSFGIPTVNIGDRQKGRIRAASIIDCEPTSEAIQKAIEQAISPEFRKFAITVKNPYSEGDTTNLIVETIKEFLLHNKIKLKKKFYDWSEMKNELI